MNAVPTVVSIGDGIIDVVELKPGVVERFPGGAALNLAVGIARLGLKSIFVTRFGLDRDGFRIERHLREEGVKVLNSPNVDFTGVVSSSRENGEPTYHFAPSMFRRRIGFTDSALQAIASADAVVVNSFPFGDRAQARELAEALRLASGLVVVDPNPRANLVTDPGAYRVGVEMAMEAASLVKLSDEDVAFLYDAQWHDLPGHLFGIGIEVALFTHGSGGAGIVTESGVQIDIPVPRSDSPVIDTMGAGDATLAAVIAFVLRQGQPLKRVDWRAGLVEAMEVAAATCRSAGGGLVLPPGYLAALGKPG